MEKPVLVASEIPNAIDAPKSVRLQIALFGRTNTGKSSFLNMVAGQETAVTSAIPGTTTDTVEKTMELLPIGPVVFLDTAGIDDKSRLSKKRLEKTKKTFDRADIGLIITEPSIWGKHEEHLALELKKRNTPAIIVVNKTDRWSPSEKFLKILKTKGTDILLCSSTESGKRNRYISSFKELLIKVLPEDFLKPRPIIGDLVPKMSLAILIVPIDLAAPKGRIILPQVQVIRDLLDHTCAALTVKENGYKKMLAALKKPPAIAVCDSQVADKIAKETPKAVKCTTFSILFSRYKGDLEESVRGAAVLDGLKETDRILIAEACSHHPVEDDIGRVKLPKWLAKHLGFKPRIDTVSGRDYPDDLSKYRLVIHCGACMITRKEMLLRIEKCKNAGVAVTNYGVCICHMFGILDRMLGPFLIR